MKQAIKGHCFTVHEGELPMTTFCALRGTISWNATATMSACVPAASIQGFKSRVGGGKRPLTLYVPACAPTTHNLNLHANMIYTMAGIVPETQSDYTGEGKRKDVDTRWLWAQCIALACAVHDWITMDAEV